MLTLGEQTTGPEKRVSKVMQSRKVGEGSRKGSGKVETDFPQNTQYRKVRKVPGSNGNFKHVLEVVCSSIFF